MTARSLDKLSALRRDRRSREPLLWSGDTHLGKIAIFSIFYKAYFFKNQSRSTGNYFSEYFFKFLFLSKKFEL